MNALTSAMPAVGYADVRPAHPHASGLGWDTSRLESEQKSSRRFGQGTSFQEPPPTT